MKKYLVVPGKVRARDGDIHMITAEQLMDLYRVDPKECVLSTERPGVRNPEGLIELRPQNSGDYTPPRNKGNW